MAAQDWINHPSLANMDPLKKDIILELMENADGKSLAKVAPYLQKATSRMQKEHLSFTEEENALIIDVITQGMSPAERRQFETARQILLKSHG